MHMKQKNREVQNGSREDEKLWEKRLLQLLGTAVLFLCITLMFSLLGMITAMAATPENIELFGEEHPSLNSYYYAEDEVLFRLRGGEREICYRVSYDDSEMQSTYLPMEKVGEFYELQATSCGHEYARYQFYETDENHEAVPLFGDNFYGIHFDLRMRLPKVTLSMEAYQKARDVYYVSAQNPKLYVEEGSIGPCTVSVLNEEEGSEKIYKVDGALSVLFREGNYTVNILYEEDGQEKIMEGYPIRFVYDETPPDEVTLELKGAKGMQICSERPEYQLVQSGNLGIRVKAEDSLSGVEKYYIRAGNKVHLGQELTLRSGFSGNVEAWAVDHAGNESRHCRLDQTILLEDTAPVIEVSSRQADGKFYFDVELSDEQSGLCEAVVELDEKPLKQAAFREDEICRQQMLRVEVPASFAEGEGNCLTVTCRDFAGNTAKQDCPVRFVDENAPRIRLSGIGKGDVTGEPVGLQVEIEDENLTGDGVTITGNVTCGGKTDELTIDSPEDLFFTKDGNYHITVSAQDRFNNRSTEETFFTIDSKPPEIRGIREIDHGVFSGFSMKDRIAKMFHDDTPVLYSMYVNGKDYFEEDIDEPGEYTILVYAVDRAGNRSEEQATFVVRDPMAAGQAEKKTEKIEIEKAEKILPETGSVKEEPLEKETARKASESAEKQSREQVEKVLITLFFILAIAFIAVILSIVRSAKSDI